MGSTRWDNDVVMGEASDASNEEDDDATESTSSGEVSEVESGSDDGESSYVHRARV